MIRPKIRRILSMWGITKINEGMKRELEDKKRGLRKVKWRSNNKRDARPEERIIFFISRCWFG